MHLLFCVLVGLTFFLAISLVALAILNRPSQVVALRLMAIVQRKQPTNNAASLRPKRLQKTLLAAVSWFRGRFSLSENVRLTERFAQAAFRKSSQRDLYFTARLLCPVAAAIIGSLTPSSRMFWICALAGVAYLAPDLVLEVMIKRRREKIRLGVPDAIDLLVICVDAGLGLDQAMLRVGKELGTSHPEIHEELLQINREQRAGKLRIDAWQSMAHRTKLPEIDGFVNMLMQTERFGTPIARALSSFGDNIRQRRRQRAEELAAKTTVKIIFPLVFFIFPCMFLVLLGPAAIGIMRSLGSH